MERLLVTGIDYPLGCNLALQLADRCEVLGLYNQHAIESPWFRAAHCLPRDHEALADLVGQWQPNWMIHCGPLSATNWDDAPASDHDDLQLAQQLSDLAGQTSARLTLISSDAVFSGPRMFHEETSPAGNPSPCAAETLAIEQVVESTGGVVVRTHAYGWSPLAAHGGFVEQMFAALSSAARPAADGRRHATPILATDLADLLWRMHELRLHGLYHLTGAERTSPYRLACELASLLDLHLPAARDVSEETAGRLLDETSLNSKRARRAMERATPMLREGLERFVEQAHNGWRDRCLEAGAVSSGRMAA